MHLHPGPTPGGLLVPPTPPPRNIRKCAPSPPPRLSQIAVPEPPPRKRRPSTSDMSSPASSESAPTFSSPSPQPSRPAEAEIEPDEIALATGSTAHCSPETETPAAAEAPAPPPRHRPNHEVLEDLGDVLVADLPADVVEALERAPRKVPWAYRLSCLRRTKAAHARRRPAAREACEAIPPMSSSPPLSPSPPPSPGSKLRAATSPAAAAVKATLEEMSNAPSAATPPTAEAEAAEVEAAEVEAAELRASEGKRARVDVSTPVFEPSDPDAGCETRAQEAQLIWALEHESRFSKEDTWSPKPSPSKQLQEARAREALAVQHLSMENGVTLPPSRSHARQTLLGGYLSGDRSRSRTPSPTSAS